ncbi:MAG: 23S rRNA pseudouridine(1911/1915/1917) synthase RluD [Woeseiaceae bacterium]|jgi:23S rRNA pseudouridine1911/1915/1917 synthase|nr:23S rRNA pseudouridine(1911/1915/1917) synthase RluD [Woeseiaceae bacterium]MDG1016678.1 23S rRNA pseudouridine(1911/1915/1917) synthase RluD [Woeseiaceae bacterium]MDG1865321.1 23S rRNA pseudouridine(1911/1915/1917) synthase RluD [Woeseiaceae bacterium]
MTNYSKKMIIPDELAGNRLDLSAAKIFSEFSRNRIKSWIKDGSLLVDGQQLRPRDIINGGEIIELQTVFTELTYSKAEPITLDIRYEDEQIAVINKPVGLVVHPGAGNLNGTLMNGLLHQWPDLNELPRAGIVHRLDKETSGLMVVAKTHIAHNSLVRQLEKREVTREYDAICNGVLTGGGTINEAIKRHHVNRKKMTVRDDGKEAITHYRVQHRFRAHTHIKVSLETGRTHQIRVHFAYRRHTLVGDPLYGRLMIPAGCSSKLREALSVFKRQALCATKLKLIHPLTTEELIIEIPPADDFKNLLSVMQEDLLSNEG